MTYHPKKSRDMCICVIDEADPERAAYGAERVAERVFETRED